MNIQVLILQHIKSKIYSHIYNIAAPSKYYTAFNFYFKDHLTYTT